MANVSKILHITIVYIIYYLSDRWPKINPKNVYQLAPCIQSNMLFPLHIVFMTVIQRDEMGWDDKREIVETKKQCLRGKNEEKTKREPMDGHRNAKNLQSVWFEFKLIRVEKKKPHPKLNIMNVCVFAHCVVFGWGFLFCLFSFLFQMIPRNVRVCV